MRKGDFTVIHAPGGLYIERGNKQRSCKGLLVCQRIFIIYDARTYEKVLYVIIYKTFIFCNLLKE